MREILGLLQAFYDRYGYRPFRMSKFERYELYADQKDFLVSDRVITFNDTDGSLLALKPDVTLSIVKSARIAPGEKQKLYYQESVYRPAGTEGHFREITQCGLECLGELTDQDFAEVLQLASLSVRLMSPKSMLCVSHLGIFDALFDCLNAGEQTEREILRLVATRNIHELRELFEREDLKKELLGDVEMLLGLTCTAEELPEKLRELRWIPEALVETVRAATEGLDASFDFSIVSDTDYYNGFVFRGYLEGVSEKVLSGGQYDRLMRRMNRPGSAIGFAVYLNLLPQTREETDLLLLCDDKTDPQTLQETVLRLRNEGRAVSVRQCREVLDLRGGGQTC